MPTAYTIASIVLSFLVTLMFLPYWIRRAKAHNLTLIDEQKIKRKVVAGLGGLIVVLGAMIGILSYVAVQVFVYQNDKPFVLLAATSAILLALIIGLIDDLLGRKIGLQQRHKPFLSILIALPIMAVNAGVNVMSLPFIGDVNLGQFYPLLIIPIAIIGAANGFNMLAGMNGLEAGLGIIILGTLGYISWVTHASVAALIAACSVAALIAFLWFNKYPAKILPGDTLTYSIGATIAIVAITGNIEKYALLLFIPYFIELALKARGKMQKESLARPLQDGSLVNKYKKFYSLNHVAISFLRKIKKRAYEYEAVVLLLGFQMLIAAGVLYLFLSAV